MLDIDCPGGLHENSEISHLYQEYRGYYPSGEYIDNIWYHCHSITHFIYYKELDSSVYKELLAYNRRMEDRQRKPGLHKDCLKCDNKYTCIFLEK